MNTECNPLIEAMLLSYKDLETRCKHLDETALRIALSSMNMNVYEAIEKVTQLYEEREVYCSIKAIIDETLIGIKAYELIRYYEGGETAVEVQGESKISERTLYRRLLKQKAILSYKILSKYTEADLKEIISDNRWLMSIYRECLNKASGKRKGVHRGIYRGKG